MPLFFIFWLALEIVVLVSVADALGAFMTLLLLIFAMILGSRLIRHQHYFFAQHMQTPQPDLSVLQEGMYRLLAGFLLIVPGFISDILAICLLLPALRRFCGHSLLRAFKPDIVARRFGWRDMPENTYEFTGNVQARREDGSVIEAELMDKDR